MNPYLEKKAWKSIPHSERMKNYFGLKYIKLKISS